MNLKNLHLTTEMSKNSFEFLNNIIKKEGSLVNEVDLVQKNGYCNLRDYYNKITKAKRNKP